MVLNTTASWLDYMQVKATEMESTRVDVSGWVKTFMGQVAAAELAL